MKYVLAALVLLLSACSQSPDRLVSDQCLRVTLFQQCLAHLPAGPMSTKYNDWSEVVSECGSQSYYQGLRKASAVKPECAAN